jgi:hypothetical protein
MASAVLPTPAIPPTAEITVAPSAAVLSSSLVSSCNSAARPAKCGKGAGSWRGTAGRGAPEPFGCGGLAVFFPPLSTQIR